MGLQQHDSSDFLHAVYNCPPGELSAHRIRYERLYNLFTAQFQGNRPQFIVRAPGRVNLIGEHTDYNGYPVLPMAIDRDFIFVLASNSGRAIHLQNENPSFDSRTFDAIFPVAPYQQGDWGNYVKAAIHGILDAGLVDAKNALGFDAVIGGTIPESAGLSSSSALVVASAMAFLAASSIPVNETSLADLLAHAERYVGSEGGGMDQAVSLLAEAGKALKIDFFPLKTKHIPLPENVLFVVCNSLIRAPKSEGVRYAYNRRVIECRLATALVSNVVGQKTGRSIRVNRLADLSAGRLGVKPEVLSEWALQAIGNHSLSLAEIARRLGRTRESVEKENCTLRDGTTLKEPNDGFHVWNRYRHVVTEAERVELFGRALQEGDLEEIGSLMNLSHTSCRDDYEISCPELEALVSAAREHGALGARLTGAGFGGCTVNAVLGDNVERFIHAMTVDYYEGYVKREKGREFTAYRDLRDVMFPCRASKGAGYWPAADLMG